MKWFTAKEEEKIEASLREERVFSHLSKERQGQGLPPPGTPLDAAQEEQGSKKEKRKKPKTRNGYKRLSLDDNGNPLRLKENDPSKDPGVTWWHTWGVPIMVLFIASLVLYSQLQLSFETQYHYDWSVKNIVERGDGKTYSYNMWGGVQQLWSEGAAPLAVLVLLWSGVFPYFKLATILWLDRASQAPSAKPCPEYFRSLSVVAKWSFLGKFLLMSIHYFCFGKHNFSGHILLIIFKKMCGLWRSLCYACGSKSTKSRRC